MPPDYPQLHEDDKTAARVKLCTSYYDPKRPTLLISDPIAFVAAFRFWKAYYRKKNPRNQAKYAFADAPYHDEWIDIVGHHRRSVMTSFRDSGKTMVLAEELPEFCVTTRPHTPVQYSTSAQDLSEKQVRAVKMDIERSDLILRDFGDLRPKRGSGLVWRNEYIELPNGSSMKAISAEKRQRGSTQMSLRGLLMILDDWEVDKRNKNAELRSDAEDYLFDVLFPMAEPGAWWVWPNTLLSINSWAMKATNHEDPRFDSWFCKRWDIDYYEEVDGAKVRRSSWPARFPVEKLEAMETSGDAEVIGFGAHSFNKEFRNRPGSKSGSAFEYNPDVHSYYWTGDRNKKLLHDVETGQEIDYEELKERSIAVVGTDLAMGKTHGDYSAITAARLDDQGVLWVLETWFAKAGPMDSLYQALGVAEYWDALAIAVEKITFEQVAIDQLEEELNRRREKSLYAPEVYICNRAGAESKKIRTLRLQYRFRENKIKIPVHGDAQLPFGHGSRELEEQIIYFTYTGGNLRNDDLLDSLVACQEAFQGIGRVAFSPKRAKTMIDNMREARKAGVVYWPGSQNVDALELTNDLIKQRQAGRPIEDEDLSGVAAGFAADWDDGAGSSVFDFGEF